MKKIRFWIWGIVGLSLLVSVFLMIVGPQEIVMHFNGSGTADSWGGSIGLLLEPVMMLGIGLICDRVAIHQRKRSGLVELPVILVNEWRLIALMGTAFVVMSLLQLNQIGMM